MAGFASGAVERDGIPEFEYRAGWAGRSLLPGAHRSRVRGPGELFRECVPLQRFPDLRRLDLRAMARDPMEGVHVRIYERRTAIRVYLLADLSRSMHFQAASASCLEALVALARSVAASACTAGDRFGLIACATDDVRPALWPARRSRSAALEAIETLHAMVPGQSAQNILEALHALPRERALIFLASDFHWPMDLMERVLDGLGQHDCVPIWFRAKESWQWLPRWGLCRLRDFETGQSRLMLLRPRLRERVLRAAAERHAAIERAFALRGLEACVMAGGFSCDLLSEHLRGP